MLKIYLQPKVEWQLFHLFKWTSKTQLVRRPPRAVKQPLILFLLRQRSWDHVRSKASRFVLMKWIMYCSFLLGTCTTDKHIIYINAAYMYSTLPTLYLPKRLRQNSFHSGPEKLVRLEKRYTLIPVPQLNQSITFHNYIFNQWTPWRPKILGTVRILDQS